jgi:hypothetical protein
MGLWIFFFSWLFHTRSLWSLESQRARRGFIFWFPFSECV